MAKIKTLKDPKEGIFYPITSTKAVVDNNGNSVDAMITDTHTLIENLESNTGISEYPEFSEAKAYAVGDVVLYEGLLKRFISVHEAGAWDGTDVEEWNERKEREEKIDKIENNIGYKQNPTSGYYTLTSIGDKVAENKRNSDEWCSLRLRCIAGDKFTITTKGGQNAKAYALTTIDRTIYAINGETEPITNVEITATQDGYLYVNCLKSYISNFKLLVELSTSIYDRIYDNIERLFSEDDNLRSYIESVKSNLEILEYGDGEFIEGTFVQEGVIDSAGDFISITGGAFHIYKFPVIEGQTISIKTARSINDNTTRLFAYAYAYNGESKVEQIVSSEQRWCDKLYKVKEGVDNICVYCNRFVIDKPEVFKIEEQPGILVRVSELEGKTRVIDNQLQIQLQIVEDISSRLDDIESGLLKYREYQEKDCYEDDDAYKSYYYSIGEVESTVSENPRKYADKDNWRCIRIPIYKGQIISVKTKGGGTGKAYAITDLNRKILIAAAANEDTLTVPFTYNITEDGYLYVNCTGATNFSAFKVITRYEASSIRAELDDLNSRTANTEKNIDNLGKSIAELKAIPSAPKIANPLLDIRQTANNKLRVLDIGNSFTSNALAYVSGMIDAAEIDISDMCLYTLGRPSGSFKTFYDSWHNQDVYDETIGPTCNYGVSKRFGGLTQSITGASNLEKMHSCIKDNKWDLILIHQVSTYSDDYQDWEDNSDAGYLKEFLRIIRTYQPNATIGCLMPHASYTQSPNNNTAELFKKIGDSVKWLYANYGVEFIIPVAAAIENLRSSEILKSTYPDVSKGYSYDGHHLAIGLGQYVASATYFQSIFGKRYGVTIYGNTYRVAVTPEQTTGDKYLSENVSVDDNNALLAQICALLACNDMYTINSPDGVAGTIDTE